MILKPLTFALRFIFASGAAIIPFSLYNWRGLINSSEKAAPEALAQEEKEVNTSKDNGHSSIVSSLLENDVIQKNKEQPENQERSQDLQKNITYVNKEQLMNNENPIEFEWQILKNCSFDRKTISSNNKSHFHILNCFGEEIYNPSKTIRHIFLLDESTYKAAKNLYFSNNQNNSGTVAEVVLAKYQGKSHLSIQVIQNNRFISTIRYAEIEKVENKISETQIYRIKRI